MGGYRNIPEAIIIFPNSIIDRNQLLRNRCSLYNAKKMPETKKSPERKSNLFRLSESGSEVSVFVDETRICDEALRRELMASVRSRENRFGILKCPGICRLDVRYRYNKPLRRSYEGKCYNVRVPERLHQTFSLLTSRALDKEYEKGGKRRINNDEREWPSFHSDELQQRLTFGQEEEAEANETETRNQHLDLVHEELLWKLRKKKVLREVEESRCFSQSLFKWECLDPKIRQELANVHHSKRQLNQQIKEIALEIQEEEREREEEEKGRAIELKDRMLSELTSKIWRNRLSRLEEEEAEWRTNAVRKYRFDNVRKRSDRLRRALNFELLELFRHVKEEEREEKKKYRARHRKNMSEVFNELRNKIAKYPARTYNRSSIASERGRIYRRRGN
ncbi:trichohyalin-like [Centruroides sculpturatus]|uniref:trichohyalin-like n=1 Tax=Centruroides sculpturatus TaxID=218467 RepID=UPI000C6D44BE|nr:trichohyalin-like [Centruroides sculpturatus]